MTRSLQAPYFEPDKRFEYQLAVLLNSDFAGEASGQLLQQ
jgi:hypothetical protein